MSASAESGLSYDFELRFGDSLVLGRALALLLCFGALLSVSACGVGSRMARIARMRTLPMMNDDTAWYERRSV